MTVCSGDLKERRWDGSPCFKVVLEGGELPDTGELTSSPLRIDNVDIIFLSWQRLMSSLGSLTKDTAGCNPSFNDPCLGYHPGSRGNVRWLEESFNRPGVHCEKRKAAALMVKNTQMLAQFES